MIPVKKIKETQIKEETGNGKKIAYKTVNKVTNSRPKTKPKAYLTATIKAVKIAIKEMFQTVNLNI